MSFKLRNTLILLVQVLILSLVCLYLINFKYPKKVDALKTELKKIEEKTGNIPEREAYLRDIHRIIKEKKELVENFDKVVESDVSFADAFRYIDQILDHFGPLKTTLQTLEEVKGDGISYRTFSLEGEGTYRSVFALIWVLEHGPKIFTIEKLQLRGIENVQREKYQQLVVISFDMTIIAKYAQLPDYKPIYRSLTDVKIPSTRNIFWPLIQSDVAPNTRGLLEVEQAELQAILPNKAIISDKKGKLYDLTEGDEVYLGYLIKINHRQNWVEFTLNKGGIVERFKLKLTFNSGTRIEN